MIRPKPVDLREVDGLKKKHRSAERKGRFGKARRLERKLKAAHEQNERVRRWDRIFGAGS